MATKYEVAITKLLEGEDVKLLILPADLEATRIGIKRSLISYNKILESIGAPVHTEGQTPSLKRIKGRDNIYQLTLKTIQEKAEKSEPAFEFVE